MSHDNRLIPSKWVSVTPSGTVVHNLIGFRVGTAAGDVAVEFQSDDAANPPTHTFLSVQVGETITGHIKRILSTGTTATGISGAKA